MGCDICGLRFRRKLGILPTWGRERAPRSLTALGRDQLAIMSADTDKMKRQTKARPASAKASTHVLEEPKAT